MVRKKWRRPCRGVARAPGVYWSTIWSNRIDKAIAMQLQAIGAYETKTHLADLLRRVREGQGFTITQRGVPVADLLPAGANLAGLGVAAAARMRQFMLEAPQAGDVDIKSLLDEGRD